MLVLPLALSCFCSTPLICLFTSSLVCLSGCISSIAFRYKFLNNLTLSSGGGSLSFHDVLTEMLYNFKTDINSSTGLLLLPSILYSSLILPLFKSILNFLFNKLVKSSMVELIGSISNTTSFVLSSVFHKPKTLFVLSLAPLFSLNLLT